MDEEKQLQQTGTFMTPINELFRMMLFYAADLSIQLPIVNLFVKERRIMTTVTIMLCSTVARLMWYVIVNTMVMANPVCTINVIDRQIAVMLFVEE